MRSIALALAFMLLCMAGCAKPETPVQRYRVHIVAFTAKWCEPCRRDKPRLESMTTLGYPVTYIDIDEQPGKADEYSILSVPTYFVYDEKGDRIYRGGNAAAATNAAFHELDR